MERIAVMDQAASRLVAAIVDGLLEGIDDEVGHQGRGDTPADDPARKDVDDEGDLDKSPAKSRHTSSRRSTADWDASR